MFLLFCIRHNTHANLVCITKAVNWAESDSNCFPERKQQLGPVLGLERSSLCLAQLSWAVLLVPV